MLYAELVSSARHSIVVAGVVAGAVTLGCAACAAAPDRGTFAGFVRGEWDCAMEDSVADGDMFPHFSVGESAITVSATTVGEDMDGDGAVHTSTQNTVTIPYLVTGDTLELDVDQGEPLTLKVAEEIPEKGEVPLVWYDEEGYTVEIDGDALRVLGPLPHDFDREVLEIIRCNRAD